MGQPVQIKPEERKYTDLDMDRIFLSDLSLQILLNISTYTNILLLKSITELN